MKPELLHVIAVYSNPMRWNSRMNLHSDFEKHMLDSGVNLTTVECQYGERPYQLPDDKFINRVRVRSKGLFWNKENLMNIGIAHTPEAKYICTADADIEFRKAAWASDTVHALQHYDVIQPWSDAYDLGPNDEHLQSHKSFCRQLWEGYPVVPTGPNFWKFDHGPYDYAHTGYAWAYTRQALEWVGGLIDFAAMGSGDHHMALALIGKVRKSVPGLVSNGYLKALLQWEDRAVRHVNGNIGFLWGTLEHKWHGKKRDRRYQERWDIITSNGYDPSADIKRNTYGVIELAGNKPAMSLALDRYFRSRNEDTNTIV